jgi:hypothetical protein
MAWELGSATRAMASINRARRLEADPDSDAAMGTRSLISRATCTYAAACATCTTVRFATYQGIPNTIV